MIIASVHTSVPPRPLDTNCDSKNNNIQDDFHRHRKAKQDLSFKSSQNKDLEVR